MVEKEAKENRSQIFTVANCPVPTGEDHHEGLDALLDLMSFRGIRLYKSDTEAMDSSPDGLIAKDDVVLLKVNAQWKYRGCTNSDLVRGLVTRILEHPDGFEGEVVIFENGQGQAAMDGNPRAFGRYSDTEVHANAEDESHSFLYLATEVFRDKRVSCYLLDDVRDRFIDDDDHETDGYRKLTHVSYPCFTTAQGTRIELKEGIWNGNEHTQNLKLINMPVLKHHNGCGITACLKHYYGVLTMGYKPVDYHYDALGMATGELMTLVRGPVLNILDCIWVSPVNHYGYPKDVKRLDRLSASLDPVAMDYWGSKHILYPVDRNPEHDPDGFAVLRDSLRDAKETINANGGLCGRMVTYGDSNTDVVTYEDIVGELRQAEARGEAPAEFVRKSIDRHARGM